MNQFTNLNVSSTLKIIFGNDLTLLAEKCIEELFFSPSHPFLRRMIVVPDLSVKDFLLRSLLLHPRLKLACGVQILLLNQAVMDILDSNPLQEKQVKIPSFLELSLVIEEQLQTPFVLKFPELLDYLNPNDEEKRRKKISALSDELARLFLRYGLYGQQFLSVWLSKEGWQQALWKEIFNKDSFWTYSIAALRARQVEFHGKLILFGFSYLSLAHLSFFSRLNASLYQLSPCALFWEDQTSDKQQLFINRQIHKKPFVSHPDENYAPPHSLLGNWGQLGREMLNTLGAFTLIEEEVYQNPKGESLLFHLKRSLLLLDESNPLSGDDSIQLHSATSKLREVEILCDALQTILHQKNEEKDPIALHEILVLSPDIVSYAPYIHMVFSDSPFPYAIRGIPLDQTSEAVRGFLLLLQLPEKHFSLSAWLELLHCPVFMQKHHLSPEDVYQLQRWFKQAKIRKRLTHHANSWEQGLDRLLFGLSIIPDENQEVDTWPLASIPQSEIDLFNRFLTLFTELEADFQSLTRHKTPSAWLAFFLDIADKYLLADWENEPFFQELRSLAQSCQNIKERKWNFDSMKRIVDHLAKKKSTPDASSLWQKIVFAPLQLGAIVPARIVWCLGMDEEGFPRSDRLSSLCEMHRLKRADYFPLKGDEDRFLFLEMLLHTRNYLIFSYQRLNAKDGKHQGPSLLIEELNQYVVKHGSPSGILKLDHPTFPFDPMYFSPDAVVKKWSSFEDLAAHVHDFPKEKNPSFFVPKEIKYPLKQKMIIDIRDLKKLARHPIQFYFNETLKIFLKEEEDEEDSEFLIPALSQAILRKKALRTSFSHLLRRIRAEGKLPHGLFQEAAVTELKEEVSALFKKLHYWGIQPEEIQTIHLSFSYTQGPEVMPPLAVPLGEERIAWIVGKLEDVTSKGLLFYGENELKSLIRAWPLYLIYSSLFSGNAPLLLTKKGEIHAFNIHNPQEELALYLNYYLLAQQTPSPLLPEWAKALLEGDREDIKRTFSRDSEDVYINFLKRRQALSELEKGFSFWSPILKKTFTSLLK